MRRTYLCDCAAGDIVEDVFVITNKQLSPTSNGSLSIKAFLSDRTLKITARMWKATKQSFEAMPEGFARVRGKVENYQGNLQIIIEQFWSAKEGTFDPADLIPHTSKDIDQMCRRLHEVLESIQNRHLAALVGTYLDDSDLMARFCKAPAAMSFHHAFLGGLLEHTLNVIEVGDCVCRFYPALNRDLVVAGLFLHDIAKTWELTYDCAFGYSDAGQLVGHIVKSAIWVEQKRKEAEQVLGEQIPQELVDVLQHIIVSHHGELSKPFGSAKSPATPEAMMVSFIDDMDAKLTIALAATRGDGARGAEGNWTEFMKALGGKLYRPDVAPAEAAVMEEVEQEPAPEVPPVPLRLVKDTEPPEDGKKPALSNPLFEISKK